MPDVLTSPNAPRKLFDRGGATTNILAHGRVSAGGDITQSWLNAYAAVVAGEIPHLTIPPGAWTAETLEIADPVTVIALGATITHSGTNKALLAITPYPYTTLSGAMNGSQTTLSVRFTPRVVPTLPFVIQLGSERMRVTAMVGSVWTVTRAYLAQDGVTSSLAESHPDYEIVYVIDAAHAALQRVRWIGGKLCANPSGTTVAGLLWNTSWHTTLDDLELQGGDGTGREYNRYGLTGVLVQGRTNMAVQYDTVRDLHVHGWAVDGVTLDGWDFTPGTSDSGGPLVSNNGWLRAKILRCGPPSSSCTWNANGQLYDPATGIFGHGLNLVGCGDNNFVELQTEAIQGPGIAFGQFAGYCAFPDFHTENCNSVSDYPGEDGSRPQFWNSPVQHYGPSHTLSGSVSPVPGQGRNDKNWNNTNSIPLVFRSYDTLEYQYQPILRESLAAQKFNRLAANIPTASSDLTKVAIQGGLVQPKAEPVIITTLSAAVTDPAALSVSLASRSALPAMGTCRLLIDTEILHATVPDRGLTGAGAVTVTRGQEGTVAATHANGASVTLLSSFPLVQGALAADATNVATTITVTAANAPALFPARLRIGAEILWATSRTASGGNWSLAVLRGQESTSGVAHTSGDVVTYLGDNGPRWAISENGSYAVGDALAGASPQFVVLALQSVQDSAGGIATFGPGAKLIYLLGDGAGNGGLRLGSPTVMTKHSQVIANSVPVGNIPAGSTIEQLVSAAAPRSGNARIIAHENAASSGPLPAGLMVRGLTKFSGGAYQVAIRVANVTAADINPGATWNFVCFIDDYS